MIDRPLLDARDRQDGVSWLVLLVMALGIPSFVGAQERLHLPDRPPDPLSAFAVDTLWTIGAADGPPGIAFGLIIATAVDSEGRILVLDMHERMVHMFDRAGRLLASAGREGEGPGEFRLPLALAVAPDGAVFIYDARIGRLTEFDRDLRFVRVVALSVPIGTQHMVVTDSAIYVAGISSAPGMKDAVIHRFDRTTGQYESSFGSAPPSKSDMIARQIGAGSISRAADGGLWHTQVAPYRIQKFSLDGKLVLEIVRENDFLPPAEDAFTLHVFEGRASVTSRPHARAFAVHEVEAGMLVHQVYLPNDRNVWDLYDSDHNLVRTFVGVLPALVVPAGAGTWVLASNEEGGGFPKLSLVRIRRW